MRVLGDLGSDAPARVLGGARFTVLPAEWYEVAPYAILESVARPGSSLYRRLVTGRPVAR